MCDVMPRHFLWEHHCGSVFPALLSLNCRVLVFFALNMFTWGLFWSMKVFWQNSVTDMSHRCYRTGEILTIGKWFGNFGARYTLKDTSPYILQPVNSALFILLTLNAVFCHTENPLHAKCTIPRGHHELPAGGPRCQVLSEGQVAVHGFRWSPGTEKQHKVKHYHGGIDICDQRVTGSCVDAWYLIYQTLYLKILSYPSLATQ